MLRHQNEHLLPCHPAAHAGAGRASPACVTSHSAGPRSHSRVHNSPWAAAAFFLQGGRGCSSAFIAQCAWNTVLSPVSHPLPAFAGLGVWGSPNFRGPLLCTPLYNRPYNGYGSFLPLTPRSPWSPGLRAPFTRQCSRGLISAVMEPSRFCCLRSFCLFLKLRFAIKIFVIFYPALPGVLRWKVIFRKP